MSPEEDYAEALRRICEAENTGATSLDLSRLAFLYQLPQELERLKPLQTLNLSWCMQLTDVSPLAGLPTLQSLNIHLCNLTDLTPLARLTSLQTLNLSRCQQLTDLSPLARLTSLQTLNLSWCKQLTDLTPLAGLTALQTLNLSLCGQLTDLTPLAGLTALQSLNLSSCGQLTDLTPLARLTSLQTLNLSSCGQLTDLTPLARLTSLQTPNLSECKQLTDLTPLAGLTALQSLNLSSCGQLTDLTPLARLTSLQTLNLSSCKQLTDLTPLARLTSLQTLNLSWCKQLTDLTPLAGLTALQSLNLSSCGQLTDLTPLARLTSLQTLNLSECNALRNFDPVKELLPSLQALCLFVCKLDDLPSEVCGESDNENVLDKVRAHYEDLKSGQRFDAEVKALFLGNGGTGKTQLCRRLRGEPFDASVLTTHGIHVNEKMMELEDFPEPVRLNLWDFGGQEIYHGSHALFLQGQAVFLILWTPKLEKGDDCGGNLTFRHRPLSYWLDYLRAFSGVNSSVLLIQSQCDTVNEDAPAPAVAANDFPSLRHLKVSARTNRGLGTLTETFREAVHDCFERRPPPPIGRGRVAVRDRLRKMQAEDHALPPEQRQHRLLERAEFDRLCDEAGGISDKETLLDFLHHSGAVFHRAGLFGGRIVLDQNWALEAIYALFDRKKTLPLLRGFGRFSRADLEALIWSDYTPEEQRVFLSMMESCGICFKVRQLPSGEWEYLAPELLPPWSDAQDQLLARLRDDQPAAEAEARYAFLHEGILRGYLSKIGQHAKDVPVYWKYGCWFYERTTKSQVLIDSQWEDSKTETGPGLIRFRAWGEHAQQLVEPLLVELRRLPVGQPPQIEWQSEAEATGQLPPTSGVDETRETGLKDLEIPARPALPLAPGKPEVFVSYAWGDDSSQEALQRQEVVEQMCKTLEKEEWKIIRDMNAMRTGDQISIFMKRISLGDHVIVVLSDKYLRSPYCMTELYGIYQRSVGEKEDFLRRIIPLALDDARFGTWRDRDRYAEQWETEFKEMEQALRRLGVVGYTLYTAMRDWANHVADILAYVNDVLHPHGFKAILKDDYAALRQMLQRTRSELRA